MDDSMPPVDVDNVDDVDMTDPPQSDDLAPVAVDPSEDPTDPPSSTDAATTEEESTTAAAGDNEESTSASSSSVATSTMKERPTTMERVKKYSLA